MNCSLNAKSMSTFPASSVTKIKKTQATPPIKRIRELTGQQTTIFRNNKTLPTALRKQKCPYTTQEKTTSRTLTQTCCIQMLLMYSTSSGLWGHHSRQRWESRACHRFNTLLIAMLTTSPLSFSLRTEDHFQSGATTTWRLVFSGRSNP
jgi:hypothetical protein